MKNLSISIIAAALVFPLQSFSQSDVASKDSITVKGNAQEVKGFPL